MKPSPFVYHDPATLDDALAVLAREPNARALAGGQSLMPMMNFRVANPDALIDLNRIPGLAYLREASGEIAIGAMTRQRDVEYSPLVARHLPVLRDAILQVGHRQTRNRGTVGGSLCHLDPSAEIPTIACLHDATLVARSVRGERRMSFATFAQGLMTNALAADELLVEVRITPWPAGHGHAFQEFARRHGDFAIVSAGALVQLDAAGRIARVAVALGGACAAPCRLPAVEAALAGLVPDATTIAAAAKAAHAIEALDDPAYPAWYRQRLAVTLTERALGQAVERAARG